MIPVRHFWALSALAITLILGACSSPEDLVSPILEPQFGTEHNDIGVDISASPNGNIFGLSNVEDLYFQNDIGAEENDVYLNRYDAAGKLIWSRRVSSGFFNYDNGNERFVAPVKVHSDKYGVAYVFVAEREDIYLSESSTDRVYKYDSAGKLIKTISLEGPYDYYGSSMSGAVDATGNIFFLDTYDDAGYVFKYTTNGTFVWKRALSVGETADISVASNGNIFVAGATGVARLTTAGKIAWTKSGVTENITTSGTNTIYARYHDTVRKLDANGKQLWSKTQSGLSGMVIGDMVSDSSGNIYLTGKYNASSGNRNVFTRKLNSSGKVLWTKTFGTSAYDDARGIATLNGSEIYITGATQGALAHSFKGGENDGYVAKLSSSGNPVWKR